MPITKSAKKKQRRDKSKTLANQKMRQRLKKAIKMMRRQPTKKNYRHVTSLLDRIAKKQLVHKNKTSRLKSRLAKLLQ